VTRSTAEILKIEWARGAEISSQALSGKVSWEKLFEEPIYIPATKDPQYLLSKKRSLVILLL
jgi:poly(A) polymerase Pap1